MPCGRCPRENGGKLPAGCSMTCRSRPPALPRLRLRAPTPRRLPLCLITAPAAAGFSEPKSCRTWFWPLAPNNRGEDVRRHQFPLLNDCAAGLLMARGGLWHRVLLEAQTYALTRTPTTGCRTLDVLHVATAKLLGVSDFCTFDTRQSTLAGKVGLAA